MVKTYSDVLSTFSLVFYCFSLAFLLFSLAFYYLPCYPIFLLFSWVSVIMGQDLTSSSMLPVNNYSVLLHSSEICPEVVAA